MNDERNDSQQNEHGNEQRGSRSCGSGRRQGGRHSRQSRRHGGHHRRKEHVLHTRISEQLSEDIRRLADDLRVPVSNVVRNVLEEVFTVVDNVSEDVGDFFEDVLDEAESVRERIRIRQEGLQGSRSRRRRRAGGRPRNVDVDVEDELQRDEANEASSASPEAEEDAKRPKRFPDVLGWQPIVMNRDIACASCETPLAPGDRAFVGIGAAEAAQAVLCSRCVEAG